MSGCKNHFPFRLQPLPYPLDGLEPYLDRLTVTIHHDRHQRGYQEALNRLLAKSPEKQCLSLEQLICQADQTPEGQELAFQAGGLWCHEFYFDCMTRAGASLAQPSGCLAQRIERDFGGFQRFQKDFTDAAIKLKGSGWVWLVSGPTGALSILQTPLQQTPLVHGLYPILVVDVWEHAYYLKYQNRRDLYLQNWWQLADWEFALQNYQLCVNGTALQ